MWLKLMCSLDYKSKQAIHVSKTQIRENDFYPPKCLCLFDYPLYKLRGLSGAVFRACITSFLRRKMAFPTSKNLTMWNLVQMRGLQCRQRHIWRLRADRIENESACAQRKTVLQAHACTMRVCGVEYPRACDKRPRRKIRMDFSQISCELTG